MVPWDSYGWSHVCVAGKLDKFGSQRTLAAVAINESEGSEKACQRIQQHLETGIFGRFRQHRELLERKCMLVDAASRETATIVFAYLFLRMFFDCPEALPMKHCALGGA